MLTINSNCTGCGICSRACPSVVIALDEGIPSIKREGCIRCGQCEAICPQNALHNSLLPEDTVDSLERYPVLSAEQARLFLRARRSIRCFKSQPVSEAETRRLLEAGRYAQTGSNSQGVSYLVLSTPEQMDRLRQLTLAWYKEARLQIPPYGDAYEILTRDNDRLLRSAPMCILALTPGDLPHRAVNTRYALTYIELMAPSLGLGTCWAGFVERYVCENSPELLEALQVPDHLMISGALLYGYPVYRYYRTTRREPLQLYWR